MSDGNIGASINAYNTSLDISFGEVYEVDKGLPVGVIANPYNSTQTYAPGDYVIYKSKLYRCIVTIEEPEEFDSEKWVQVKLANEVQDLAENLDAKADKSTTYTKTEINGLLDEKANASDVASALALKADESDLQALSTTVSDKADKSDVYTKEQTYSQTEVNNLIKDSNLIIADKFDENETYYWGSFVIYEGELYVLWEDEFSGPFDPEVWSKYTVTQYVAEEFDETNGIIRRIDNNKMERSNPTGTGVLSINRKANTTVGEESVAFGYNPTASGEQSIAGGYNATASNTVSVALGNGASASGFAATAFGTSTRATGNYSQAEGYQTRAGGGSSHSEGNQTTASGGASHAEGAYTQSSGQYSHAEGNGSISSGISSHAEGYSSVASGDFSHAEGFSTHATEIEAHAEGYFTTASGQAAHAEGEYTEANHRDQHVFGSYNIPDDSEEGNDQKGNYIEIVGNGYWDNEEEEAIYSNARTLDWSGNEVLAGDLTYNGNKSLTSEISRLDGKIDNLPAPMIFKGTLGVGGTIQTLPTASASNEGYTYKVITDGTYAGQAAKVGDIFTSNGSSWVLIPSGDEGTDTWRAIKVNGTEKLANSISSGDVDFVNTDNIEVTFDTTGNKVKIATKNIYTQTQVDTALSNKLDKSNPTGTGSLSLNRKSGTDIGSNSVAVGNNTEASGEYSFAEGTNTVASSYNAHAEGNGSIANDTAAHAEGIDTTASYAAHAEGDSTVASGDSSHAEGHSTTARGNYSHAEGEDTTASGYTSHAEGKNTTSSEEAAHAEGTSTTASADAAHAEGYNTTASGYYSHAQNFGTVATRRSQNVFGEYNIAESGTAYSRGDYVEIVGNGENDNSRSNARTLDWDGNEVLAGDLTFNGSTSLTNALGAKANSSDVYTKQQTDTKLSTLRGNIASDYSSSQIYEVGDCVIYNEVLYQCNTAITVAEEWTPAHWTQVKATEISGGSGSSTLSGLTDVTISSVSNGQVLKYDNTSGKWINANESTGSSSLTSLTDVNVSSATEGQVLKYDSTSQKWVNGTGGSGASTLADLTDTVINNPQNGQMLIYDGTNHVWRNVVPSYGYNIAGILEAGQTSITFTNANILSDSYIQVFTPNGTEFNSITATTGSVTITFDAQSSDLSVCVRLT